ncbi:RNA polymerase sigma factor [Bacteroides sp. 519]|uniref:RNA polymerase sigma factor n=1 Tax=Bacteroides sp. 519 TaxID=2302937 RepID=UPI0013D06923|nr:sigma-70 family RNA polymerase sigma factor [Bacteroides sp. 519]NDV58967.1 sigma-70 family RNA polymerase sigma factor [Bacteroides sp. 519]
MWFQRKKNISTLTDDELLQKHKESADAESFSELFSRYVPLMYGVCLDYLRDEDKAHDAVMQLFEDLLHKVSRYEIGVFRTWVYSVTKNHCLQILNKEKKEILIDFELNVMESEEILNLFSEDNVQEEQIDALNHCLEKLPDNQRVSIKHFFMDEMSYADIVDETGYPLSKVKSYIQNAKRNLKNCIDKQLT